MMRRIEIYDTTLRDGTQGEGVSLSLEDKLRIATRLDDQGFDFIEGGYPMSNPKDSEFFRRILQQPLQHAKVCAFGMTRRKSTTAAEDRGMKALLDSGASVITLVGKTSKFQVQEVLRVSLDENLAMIGDSVRYLREAGREVVYDAEHFFDGWKQDPDYAVRTLRAAVEAGAGIVVLCDTNGGSMPEEIAEMTRLVVGPAVDTGRDPLPQRLCPGSRQFAWRRSTRGPLRFRARSMALVNGVATPTWWRWLPISP